MDALEARAGATRASAARACCGAVMLRRFRRFGQGRRPVLLTCALAAGAAVLQAHSPTVKEHDGLVRQADRGGARRHHRARPARGHRRVRHRATSSTAGRRHGARGAARAACRRATCSRVFFRATFQVMGHVAKADGRVTEQEIDAARDAMRRFSLSDADVRRGDRPVHRGQVARLPARGRARDVLRTRRRAASDLRRLFVQIQLEAALQGGGLSATGARACSRASAARSASRPSNSPRSRPCCACAARRAAGGGRRGASGARDRLGRRLPGAGRARRSASDADVTLGLPPADEPEPPGQAGGQRPAASR
ncbi:MAG: hypothetical protein MZV65_38060 [Chromatiales bacterium]|nr:hypothetical protein [Chromatiales bacterium]